MSEAASPPLTFSEIVAALVRVFTIKLGIESISYGFTLVSEFNSGRPMLASLLVTVFVLICLFTLWQIAPRLARLITRGGQATITTTSLTLIDLYTFAFLFVGLWFAVDSLGPSLTWLHYAVTQGSSDGALTPVQKQAFYTLFKYLVKLSLGLALIFNGRNYAGRFVRRQQRSSSASNS